MSRKISPFRICFLDQRKTLCSSPALNLFFAGNCLRDLGIGLDVDKGVDAVFSRKGVRACESVFDDPSFDIVRNSRVEDTRLGREDVDVIPTFHPSKLPRKNGFHRP